MEAEILHNYIGGEWKESRSNQTLEVINPATLEVLSQVSMSASNEADEAVAAAKAAFPDWRRTPPLARSRYLFDLREALEENFDELSRIGVMEHGKTLDEMRGEVRRGIENIEVAAGIPSLMMGYNLEDVARGIDEYVIQQPCGVFANVAPFNFPFMVPLWFLPYAIATGNTFVVKPSPLTPMSMTRFLGIVDEIGLPAGVVNMVHGGAETVNALIKNPDLAGITFVGSTRVGRDVIYKEGAAAGKKVLAQCGAKNALVVLPDADLDNVVPSLMTSVYGNAGQRCLAGANVIVVGNDAGFYSKLKTMILDAAAAIRVGYGLDETVQMGPLASPEKKERVVSYIETGVKEGATLSLDGRHFSLVGDCPDDSFLGPSVFEDVTPQMTIAREEIFGPVMAIMRADSLGQAIGTINAGCYGNAASLYTGSGKAARQFQYEVQAGNIGINVGVAAPMAFFPFSGTKDSFFGDRHGQGRDAVQFFTERKVVIQRWF